MPVSHEAEAAIARLQTRHLRVIDDDELEDWPELFTETGVYRIVTRENHAAGLPLAVLSCENRGMMRDRVTAMRRINVYEPQRYTHQVSGLEITATAPDRYRCVSSFLVVRTLQTGAMSIFATGVYRDHVVVEAGEARFEERLAITDSRQVDTLLVIPI